MVKRNIRKRKNGGFTLIELVIVVAILAILVGIIAPQYTKYVEKSRKAADASNMEELVKAVEIYIIDGHSLTDNFIEIRIGIGTGTLGNAFNSGDTALKAAFNEEFPNFSNLHMKSKKWGREYINAEITVKTDGTLSVKYSPDSFEKYMAGGES